MAFVLKPLAKDTTGRRFDISSPPLLPPTVSLGIVPGVEYRCSKNLAPKRANFCEMELTNSALSDFS